MGAADFITGLDLLNAVLLDAGERATGLTGDYSTEFAGYIRRAYWEILSVERWPWALSPTPGTLVTVASREAQVESITAPGPNDVGSTVTLSESVADSLKGRKLYLDSNQAVYRIDSHTAGETTLILDAEYVEPDTSGTATIYQDEYALLQKVMRMWDPLQVRGQWWNEIHKLDKPIFEAQYGKGYTSGPAPLENFTEIHWDFSNPEGVRRIRIAPWAEERYVLEYDYSAFHNLDFSGAAVTDTPRIPREYRQVIVDYALYKAHLLKDDQRTDAEFLNAHRLYQAMKEVYLGGARSMLSVRPKHSFSLGTT